jgi:hypothetical protein
MSNPQPPRPPEPSPPTRQQLDELDALLQRMLELPVNHLDETPPPSGTAAPAAPAPVAELPEGLRPPVKYVVVETAGQTPAAPTAPHEERPQLRVVPADETPATGGDEPDWVPLRTAWRPSAQTWPPLADSWRQAQAHEQPATSPPQATTTPDPQATANADEDDQDEDTAADAAEPAVTTVRWPLRPVVAFDHAFYRSLSVFGPPGRWLGSSLGRTLLGFVGLACLAGAAALLFVGK